MSAELGRPWWGFDPDERPLPLVEQGVVTPCDSERTDERPPLVRDDTDPAERPVPLTHLEVTGADGAQRGAKAGNQPRIRAHRDPAITARTSVRDASLAASASGRSLGNSSVRGLVTGPRIALFLAACVVAFAIGWIQGAKARTHSLSSPQVGRVAETTSGVRAEGSTKRLTGNQKQRPHYEEVLAI